MEAREVLVLEVCEVCARSWMPLRLAYEYSEGELEHLDRKLSLLWEDGSLPLSFPSLILLRTRSSLSCGTAHFSPDRECTRARDSSTPGWISIQGTTRYGEKACCRRAQDYCNASLLQFPFPPAILR